MKTLNITREDIKKSNSYLSDYIGKEDVSNYDGNIEIDANLGYIRFNSIKASGHIWALINSGIESSREIEAGREINTNLGIEAGWGIRSGCEIKSGREIKAGDEIEAGGGIEAGREIEAGWGIRSDGGIKAIDGIIAGLSITCKLSINTKKRIFAGIAIWKSRKEITEEEMTITCGRLESGEVEYGFLKETGLY